MMEPRRLLQEGASDAERALLDSARADGPPAGSTQRMLVALAPSILGSDGSLSQEAGHGAAGASPGASAAAHVIQTGFLSKAGTLGVFALVGLGLFGAGTLVHWLTGQRALPVEATGARALAPPPQPGAGGVHAPGAANPPVPEIAPAQGAPPSSAPEIASQPQAAAAADQSLRAEVEVLDAVRVAVNAHHPAAAQRVLDGYEQRFPQGHLKPEAMVLRLSVLVQQGNHTAARALAETLLADEAYNAYGHRIRSLVRAARDDRPGR
jgi:hypothetical protein